MAQHPSRFTALVAAILVAVSALLPAYTYAPSPAHADDSIMKWDTVSTPGAVFGKNDILNCDNGTTDLGNDIIDMAVGNDGMTIAWIVKRGQPVDLSSYGLGVLTIGINMLYYTNTMAIMSSERCYLALMRSPDFSTEITAGMSLPSNLYHVAIAPDDPKFIAVTASLKPSTTDITSIDSGPMRVFVSTDAGQNWELAFDGSTLASGETIRCIDISTQYNGRHDIGFGTALAAGGGRWFVRPSSSFSGWVDQDANNLPPIIDDHNYYAIRFSPTYNGDSSVALVYSTSTATYFNVAHRDLDGNNTLQYAYADGIEVKGPSASGGDSPGIDELNRASLQLPSDFSGQSASLRRAYVSLDAYNDGASKPATARDGIFRVDDTTIYTLMDTSTVADKSIYSIAYFGTYASGKLLAGERMGYPCTATVPTWFTDSPTTCPIPCWYPALKPTTGAANQGTCESGAKDGFGAAIVRWNADGSLGLASTGSIYDLPASYSIVIPPPIDIAIGGWYIAKMLFIPPVANDESAFAISRNNGETWNQLSLIDTTVDWFNDVAVAPDCTTIYLASVNRNVSENQTSAGLCDQFDSVWRSTVNPNVATPLPAGRPLGLYWERVYCRVSSGNCAVAQSDLPILRVVPSCTDKKDGEIVGWAAQLAAATTSGTGGVMAWSPDFGDFWAAITPRDPVQDFAFESSTVLYTLSANALVQRLPYTGTAWSTNLPSYDTALGAGHTIMAIPEGIVLVGIASGVPYPVACSGDKGETWSINLNNITGRGNAHVIFDVNFASNRLIYVGDDAAGGTLGTVYRNSVPSWIKWADNDMMSTANGAAGITWPAPAMTPPHPVGIFGITQAWTGDPQPALYAAHDNITYSHASPAAWGSAVCRTLEPRNGMPKPGIQWDCLDIFAPLNTTGVLFTLEPASLKYCGCCSLDTNTTLYAIDDESGNTPRWDSLVTGFAGSNRTGRYNNHINNIATPWDPAYPGYTPSYNQGMLWSYTDCLAKKGPVLKSPADKYLIGADPVTGRNQQVDLSWEQLCLATGYELQIAKDRNFTLRINPAINSKGNIAAVTGSIMLDMDVNNMTSPTAWIAPGALPEAGAIYWWRVRVYKSATTQLAYSPWSEARSFTVKAGFIVNTPYYGVQLLSPNNGCFGCNVRMASFSWSPWKGATKYQFDLARDSEFKQLVISVNTSNTGYTYGEKLDYSTNYFWRVKALEINGRNIPSDWSATFSFQTETAPAPEAPPPAEAATPLWVWVVIATGIILVIVTIILIFKAG